MNSLPKILVVDDNPNNRLSIRTILKNVEADLHEVDNGFDALSMTLNEDYALILLDALMPDMDGFEVCEQLRANPKTAQTPVIFLTAAFKGVNDNIRGYVAGATDYLAKPIDDHVLKAKVQVFLRLFNQQLALQKANEELRIAAIAFNSLEGIVVTDANAVILRVNRAFSEITGYTEEEAIGKSPALLKSGRHDVEFYRELWQAVLTKHYWKGEIWNRRKNGEIYPEWLTITAVLDADQHISHFVAVFNDITQRKSAEKKILQLAFYDPLTHLPNRRLLLDRTNQARLNSSRNHQFGAVLFMDLDQFKGLNDTQGHDIGDLLLIEVAKRLTGCVREIDTVARLGGDEFVLLLEELGSTTEQAAAHAQMIGEKVLNSLREPYLLKEYEYRTSASVGISLFKDSEVSVETLFKQADTAMYEAKNAGRDAWRFFDLPMRVMLTTRAGLETDLQQALQHQQLQMYYQMQVDTQSKRLGAEALLRWHHPSKGLLLPEQFIPMAEETGMIVPIGYWVLETVCKHLKAWNEQGLLQADFQLSINISPRQFRHAQFVERISEILTRFDVSPCQIKLELIETVFKQNMLDTSEKIRRLKALGIGFSIDDFGTGFSSLSYLKQLQLDQLKIDRSFVKDLGRSEDATVLTQTIINMGHTLGLQVIAEGVENEFQVRQLIELGCPNFQGCFFYPPLQDQDFNALLSDIRLRGTPLKTTEANVTT